ncbi:LysE family translocator [Phaeobacter piscinae]|uniref:LysE family translocator n=1 Tax=Phaeobacter piscinae TaxID=1580596 RepID=UPI00058BD046|nr:LysE family translocator [Phaeobacter piscinae]UTS79680.1 Homoserine/homoserine lactone efflux protein [Phaeobacter piscinae]
MTWALWVSFATISAVNIVTPGPANLNTVRRAIQLGIYQVAPTILGNALGLAVGGAICAAGITSFVMASDLLWSFFQWAGVAYLAWLGARLLIRTETLSLHSQTDASVPACTLFFEAFLLAATNPKALLFYMALFPQILEPERGMASQASILILTYCGLSILSLTTYSALAHAFRSRFMTPARYNRFRQGSGVLLIGFAAKLLMNMR